MLHQHRMEASSSTRRVAPPNTRSRSICHGHNLLRGLGHSMCTPAYPVLIGVKWMSCRRVDVAEANHFSWVQVAAWAALAGAPRMRPALETTTTSASLALDGWQNSKVMLLPLALPSGWKRTT